VTAPAAVQRGEVWWVNLDPTQGAEMRKTRPAVVLTADALNRGRRTVVPLSTGPAPRPPIVVSTPSAGTGSVAVCDQLRAVDRGRLIRQGGRLTSTDLRPVRAAIAAG